MLPSYCIEDEKGDTIWSQVEVFADVATWFASAVEEVYAGEVLAAG
jgi:hypothetical protein